MNDLRLLTKQNHLTLLITKESTSLESDFNIFQDFTLFLIKYAFVLTDSIQDTNSSKPQFPPPGGLFSQNSNGARYLDAKYSRWLSTDPALSYYIEKNYNGSSGGIYNSVNLNLYHYGGNNPIKYVDPDGRESGIPINSNAALGFGHTGGFEKTPAGYSFFEVQGLSDVDMEMIGIIQYGSYGDLYTSKTVISGSPEGLFSQLIATSTGRYSNSGVMKYDFNTKVELMIFLASEGFDSVIEFNTSPQEDIILYSAGITNGMNFGKYKLLSNNCGTYIYNVFTTPGTSINGSEKNSLFDTIIPKRIYSNIQNANNGTYKTYTPSEWLMNESLQVNPGLQLKMIEKTLNSIMEEI